MSDSPAMTRIPDTSVPNRDPNLPPVGTDPRRMDARVQPSPGITDPIPLEPLADKDVKVYYSPMSHTSFYKEDGRRLIFNNNLHEALFEDDRRYLDAEIKKGHPLLRSATPEECGQFNMRRNPEKYMRENIEQDMRADLEAQIREEYNRKIMGAQSLSDLQKTVVAEEPAMDMNPEPESSAKQLDNLRKSVSGSNTTENKQG